MRKTPLKQLIDEMQDLKKTKIFNNSLKSIDECIDLAYAKLEIEKEQIEKAVIFGNRQDFYDGTEEIGSNYYNSTYTQSSE